MRSKIKDINGFNLLIKGTLFLSLFFIACPPARAVEMNWPTPCYQDKKLEEVSTWEKNWVGKNIDSSNVDEIKEFLDIGNFKFCLDFGL